MNRDNQESATDDYPPPSLSEPGQAFGIDPVLTPARTVVVPRPRLMELLNSGEGHPLTLIIGPAGYGKTTVLRQWIAQLDRPSIWIQSQEVLGEPRTFAMLVLMSLQERLDLPRAIGARARVALTSGDIHPRLIGQALAEDIAAIGSPLYMVIDDFHLVSHSDLPLLVSGLLEAAPTNLRLVISSRWDPRLSLVRMRQEGLVLDIRARDLQFDANETEALLFQMLGDASGRQTVPAILDFTGGWIAAVQLAALSLFRSPDPSQFTHDLANLNERNMLDYLMDEVMARKPARLRQLVIRSSICDRICSSLAESALDLPPGQESTESMLDHLAMVGLFDVQRVGDEFWYMPHPLFRLLLLHRLAIELADDEIAALQLRASRWYEGSGLITRAIEYSLRAGAIDEAVALIKRWRLDFFVRERWQEVDSWLDMLPTETVDNHLVLKLTRLRTSVFRGLEAPTWPQLQWFRSKLEAVAMQDRDETWSLLMSELDMVTVHSNSIRVNMDDTVEIAERALAMLPLSDSAGRGVAYVQLAEGMQARGDADVALDRLQQALDTETDRSGALHGRILIAQATVYLRRGDLRRAADMFTAVLHLANVHSIQTMAGWSRVGLGILALERNDLAQAEEFLALVQSDPENVHFAAVREAQVGLILIAHARGDSVRAQSLIDHLRDWALEHSLTNALAIVDSLRARLCLLEGNLKQARQWAPITTQSVRDYLLFFEIPMLTNARISLSSPSSESIASGLKQLRDIERVVAATYNYRRLVEIKLLRAYGLNQLGDSEAAVDVMAQALDLVGREPYVRTILDLGFDLEPIFRKMGTCTSRPDNFERISSLARFARVATHRDPDLNLSGLEFSSPSIRVYELFTEREVEVLLAISQHLSNKEIAEKLFVSPLTVKRHATNIYRKLGVSSRRHALIKATELGYLA